MWSLPAASRNPSTRRDLPRPASPWISTTWPRPWLLPSQARNSSPISRGHADGDQVLGRQVRQDVSVDEIVAERGLVLLKTELLKPTRDIDRHDGSHSSGSPSIRRLRRDSNRA